MKVGVVGPVFPDSFADNILTCLPDVGARSVALGPSQPRPRTPMARHALTFAVRASTSAALATQRAIVRRARREQLDIVICLDGLLLPATVAQLRAGGAKVCLWFPDHVANIQRGLALVSDYDALFLKDPTMVARFADTLRLPTHYLPQAANPAWHRPPDARPGAPAAGREPWIAVVGNLYASRARLLSELVDNGVPLKIFGASPPRWLPDRRLAGLHTGRAVTRAEKAAVFRGAAAVLNNLHPAEMTGINLRLFEATACGAAVLAEYRPALDDLYTLEVEIAPFRTFDELLTKAKDLLADPAAGRAMGDAASARAHAEHTYQARLSRLLEILT